MTPDLIYIAITNKGTREVRLPGAFNPGPFDIVVIDAKNKKPVFKGCGSTSPFWHLTYRKRSPADDPFPMPPALVASLPETESPAPPGAEEPQEEDLSSLPPPPCSKIPRPPLPPVHCSGRASA